MKNKSKNISSIIIVCQADNPRTASTKTYSSLIILGQLKRNDLNTVIRFFPRFSPGMKSMGNTMPSKFTI